MSDINRAIETLLPQLTSHDASVVILECLIRSASRLFDERFEGDSHIAPDNLKTLRQARDTQIERLRENLRYAKKATR